MNRSSFYLLSASIFLGIGCTSSPTRPASHTDSTATKLYNVADTAVADVPDRTSSTQADLRITPCPPPADSVAFPDAGIFGFRYKENQLMLDVREFTLGSKTRDTDARGLAFTKKGQHVHLNINNETHQHSNDRNFSAPLADGSYKMYCFLVRSYYESVKNSQACWAKIVEIRGGETVRTANIQEATLLYNVPLGDYSLRTSPKILLDFYLYNTSIKSNGNAVRLTINQNKPILLHDWTAYTIEGLPQGVHSVVLELVDKNANAIQPAIRKTFRILP